MSTSRGAIVILGALLALTSSALAWGPEGHRIVARVAEAELTPAARSEVSRLLGGDAATRMAAVSNWPDWARHSHPETRAWHFVAIDPANTGYDPDRDCPNGTCIVAQIDRDEALLADTTQPDTARAGALAYLIHLVGDVHQPLHCIGTGGRDVPIDGDPHAANLHQLWDRAPERIFGNGQDVAAAALLEPVIGADLRAAAARGDVVDWANESFAIARTTIYPGLPPRIAAADEGRVLDRAIVERQLQLAGMRLAMVLNRDLAPAASSRALAKPGSGG